MLEGILVGHYESHGQRSVMLQLDFTHNVQRQSHDESSARVSTNPIKLSLKLNLSSPVSISGKGNAQTVSPFSLCELWRLVY